MLNFYDMYNEKQSRDLDIILLSCNHTSRFGVNETTIYQDFTRYSQRGKTTDSIQLVSDYIKELLEQKCIDYASVGYSITKEGRGVLSNGGFYRQYIQQNQERLSREELQELQIKDLRAKIERLNDQQSEFYESSNSRNRLQKIGIILSLVISFFAALIAFLTYTYN